MVSARWRHGARLNAPCTPAHQQYCKMRQQNESALTKIYSESALDGQNAAISDSSVTGLLFFQTLATIR